MNRIARSLQTIALVAALTGIANANTIYINNVTFGNGTISPTGSSVTWNFHLVAGKQVAFRTDGSTVSPDFVTPAGVTLRNAIARTSPDGTIGVFSATCAGGVRCVVSFNPSGTATVTSVPGKNLDVSTVFNDGTWVGNLGGVGASSGSIGTSTYTSITPSASISVYAAAQQAGLIGVGAQTPDGINSYAGMLSGNTFSAFNVLTNSSAAFGLNPNSTLAVGYDGLLASGWLLSNLSETYFPILGSSQFQTGIGFSATNNGAASGYDANGLGWIFSPLLGGSMNTCAGIVAAGGTLPSGQTVANCTIGRTTIGEFLLPSNFWTYAIFGSGSVLIADNLNASFFNQQGWTNGGDVGGGSNVPEPGTLLLCGAGLEAIRRMRKRRSA